MNENESKLLRAVDDGDRDAADAILDANTNNITEDMGTPSLINTLLEALYSCSWDKQDMIVEVLVKLGNPIVGQLVSALDIFDGRNQDTIRLHIIKALAEIGDERSVERIEQALTDQDEGVRVAAIEAVGAFGDAEYASLFSERLASTQVEREERLALMKALEALGVSGHDGFPLPLMIEKLVDDRQVRQLVAYGSEAVPILIELMQDNPPGWMADLIAEVLGEIGDKSAIGPLQKELSEWSGGQSALIFGGEGGGGFGSQLVGRINAGREETRGIIADAISKIKENNGI
jgi:HEAT repeat protein